MPDTRGMTNKVLDSLMGDFQESAPNQPSNKVNKVGSKFTGKRNFTDGRAAMMNHDASDGKRKRTQTTAAEDSQKKKNEAFKNSTKAKATFEEGDQVISMSAEGQESKFLESDDDDESNIVTFRNRPEEAEYPTEDEETNEMPKSDKQSDGEEPMDFEHEVPHQNEDGEISSDEEENFKALKKV